MYLHPLALWQYSHISIMDLGKHFADIFALFAAYSDLENGFKSSKFELINIHKIQNTKTSIYIQYIYYSWQAMFVFVSERLIQLFFYYDWKLPL